MLFLISTHSSVTWSCVSEAEFFAFICEKAHKSFFAHKSFLKVMQDMVI